MLVAAVAVLSLLLTGQTSLWPATKVTGAECAGTRYTAWYAADNYGSLNTQTLTSAGGDVVIDVGADASWKEIEDITGEFDKCTGLEDKAAFKFTRSGASGVPFQLSFTHSGRWAVTGSGNTGNAYWKIYKHSQSDITGGDALSDGTYLGSQVRTFANTTSSLDGFHTHTINPPHSAMPTTISILLDLDEGDCVGVAMATTATSQAYLQWINLLVAAEAGRCGHLD